MNKQEFINRLEYAGNLAIEFAESLPVVKSSLPRKAVFSIFPPGGISEGEPVKIWGGRIKRPSELKKLPCKIAGTYLWADGKVPAWVNLCVIGISGENTEIEIMACKQLVEANINRLQPDLGQEPGNPLLPFRIRGPSEADWGNRVGDAYRDEIIRIISVRRSRDEKVELYES